MISLFLSNQDPIRKTIVKSGVFSNLLLKMDDYTFQSHFRVNRLQFNKLLCMLNQVRKQEDCIPYSNGGRQPIPPWKELLVLLWYMSNQNSFREIGDKFGITRSSAYRVVVRMLKYFSLLLPEFFQTWNEEDKLLNAEKFKEVTGLENVIGAVDGCHIRISRPRIHGDDYINRKGYYSILLQGICDFNGQFRDVFVGAPGRIHDARLLRLSPIFVQREQIFGEIWKLLGDSAYNSHDFTFIKTPKRDNGLLTRLEQTQNTNLSRGRVIIENCFGRLKCRFRRVREVQNILLPNVVAVVLTACALHNFTTGEKEVKCSEHDNGCPRLDDDNDD